MKKVVSGIMLPLLLMNTLYLIFPCVFAGGETFTNSPLRDKNFTWGRGLSSEKTVQSVAGSVEPIINPKPGQYANYTHNCYYENGSMIWSGWWNISYVDYLAVNLMNSTHTMVRPMTPNGTLWLAINMTNRWIPYGNHWWVDSWYVPWIETDITVGSVIKMWKTDGTVIGSAISKVELNGEEMSFDCWVVHFSEQWDPSHNYTALFDKQSGVMIELASSYEPYINLTLAPRNASRNQSYN